MAVTKKRAEALAARRRARRRPARYRPARRPPCAIAASSAGAVALGDHGQDRAALAARLRRRPWNMPREQRVASARCGRPVDGRDRHRRIVEEAHEAHFGGALRIGAVVARAVEHQRARGAGRAVGAERDLVEQPHRQRAAAARLEIEVEHLGLHLARRGRRASVSSAAPSPGDDIGELQPAGADLREIVVEPGRQRGVEIDDVARRHRPRRSRPAHGRDSRSRAAVPGRRFPASRGRA